MEHIDLALPPEMNEFIQNEMAAGRYANASSYIEDLIRQEQRRKAEARLESLLLEGLDSGPMQEISSKDWDALRDRLQRKWSDRRTA